MKNKFKELEKETEENISNLFNYIPKEKRISKEISLFLEGLK